MSEQQLLGRKRFEQDTRKIRTLVPQLITPLQDTSLPYTSTAWDGDSYSTTAKTKIDLSAVFGVPANVRAIYARTSCGDADSSANDCYLILSPNDTAGEGLYNSPAGKSGDRRSEENMIVPCDANGDLYYQILATGAGTFDVTIEIWAYFL